MAGLPRHGRNGLNKVLKLTDRIGFGLIGSGHTHGFGQFGFGHIGFGRIGRSILRALYESTDYSGLQIVAINDLADIETLAHLTRYDSTHGRFLGTVEVEKASGDLLVNGDRIAVSQTSVLNALPWQGLDVDLVMESSGAFTDRAQAEIHLEAGARRVLFSQPAESDVDATLVYGINHEHLSAEARIVSNASCTTNCIVPVRNWLQEHDVSRTLNSSGSSGWRRGGPGARRRSRNESRSPHE